MKTAEEKATTVMFELSDMGILSVNSTNYADVEKKIVLAIKEQDRDTRHACAEAVMKCEDWNALNGDSDIQLLYADNVYNACMNVKAV